MQGFPANRRAITEVIIFWSVDFPTAFRFKNQKVCSAWHRNLFLLTFSCSLAVIYAQSSPLSCCCHFQHYKMPEIFIKAIFLGKNNKTRTNLTWNRKHSVAQVGAFVLLSKDKTDYSKYFSFQIRMYYLHYNHLERTQQGQSVAQIWRWEGITIFV